jgi:periplasmic protein TonB
MNESSAPARSSLVPHQSLRSASGDYRLSDDLARLCLPQEWKDSYRTLAWVNSICFMFLLVGLVGLRPPAVVHKTLSEVNEPVPVVFTQPDEPPNPEPEAKPEEERPADAPTDTPQVVTVVAAADPSSVAFAVPVQGAVAIAPAAHLATPPPPSPVNQAPPRAVQFNPTTAGGGSFPDPRYPAIAARNHYQGTVVVEFVVDEAGRLTSAKIQKSSGFPVLDEEALETLKNRWRFAPGSAGYFYKPFTFQLR